MLGLLAISVAMMAIVAFLARFFVSADVGMGEYMIKNFEAMACGCVLLAFDQGEEENRALGFLDMNNVVLYRDLDDVRDKLRQLRTSPAQAETIARNGQALAEERYTFQALGAAIVAAMQTPLRPHPGPTWWTRACSFWRW